MDDYPPARDSHGLPLPGDDETTNVARHIALVRQKDELRRERDHLLFDLARGLGREHTAHALGLKTQDLGRLLDRTRERVAPRPPDGLAEPGAQIKVRRLRARERSRLASGPPHTRAAPDRRARPEQPNDTERVARPGAPSVLGGQAASARRWHERWADADSHYESLGLQAPGDR
jgi:hypothetical protein